MKEIIPAQSPLNHTIRVIGSKSVSHRALILAALAKGTSIIKNLSPCDDVRITMDALQKCGNKIEQTREGTIILHGMGGIHNSEALTLSFENSGTSYRFFMALGSLGITPIILDGNAHMRRRPIKDLAQVLEEGGTTLRYLEETNFPPIEITGPFRGGHYTISSEISSQFISALLLISPLTPTTISLETSGIQRSVPYIKMTCDLMRKFGVEVKENFSADHTRLTVEGDQSYHAQNILVEGDYSGAAFWLVAGAIIGGPITLEGLEQESLQGDKYILSALEQMGCSIQVEPHSVSMNHPQTSVSKLHGVELDLGNYPDLVIPLSIAALFADRPSHFYNIGHLRFKESDRLALLHRNLSNLGANVSITPDSIRINPVSEYHGHIIETEEDHRIAMGFAILGLKIPGITIKDPECVSKSYPDFFLHLDHLNHMDQPDPFNHELKGGN